MVRSSASEASADFGGKNSKESVGFWSLKMSSMCMAGASWVVAVPGFGRKAGIQPCFRVLPSAENSLFGPQGRE
jgi:hypothetical protein